MRFKHLAFIIAAIFFAQAVIADTVTTKDGSVLNGTVTLIDKGIIHIDTPFAGKLKLKQEEVVFFKTESPLVFRLKDGVTTPGTVTPKKDGSLVIKAESEAINTHIADIKASWTPDKIEPELERNRRKWKNNFAFDLNGRTGNIDRFNLGMELDFRLKGPKDELYLGFDYEQGEENGNKISDRTLGQISYEHFGNKKRGWFIRSTLEKDPINDVSLRFTNSSGSSYRLINNDNQTLVIRNGLGYRFTDFEAAGSDKESTATFETGLFHTLRCKDWFYLENAFNHSPSLTDLSNNNLAHESSIRIPVGNGENFWIRIGMRNEYESETSAEEKLDTNYYTQFIYSWK